MDKFEEEQWKKYLQNMEPGYSKIMDKNMMKNVQEDNLQFWKSPWK